MNDYDEQAPMYCVAYIWYNDNIASGNLVGKFNTKTEANNHMKKLYDKDPERRFEYKVVFRIPWSGAVYI